MAVSAILRLGKSAGLQKHAAFGGSIARHANHVLTKPIVVVSGYAGGGTLPLAARVRLRFGSRDKNQCGSTGPKNSQRRPRPSQSQHLPRTNRFSHSWMRDCPPDELRLRTLLPGRMDQDSYKLLHIGDLSARGARKSVRANASPGALALALHRKHYLIRFYGRDLVNLSARPVDLNICFRSSA